MGSGRRLELALREYCVILGLKIDSRNRGTMGKMEKAVSQDQALGSGVASRIRELRQRRNRVAHESVCLSSTDAVSYAQRAFGLIAILGKRVSELESTALTKAVRARLTTGYRFLPRAKAGRQLD
jgi:hypothetical protein